MLARVSRGFRSTADSTRYFSVAIHGLRHLAILVDVLVERKTPSNMRHLFLTTEVPKVRVRSPRTRNDSKKAREYGIDISFDKSATPMAHVDLIERLLTLVAPSLLSLCVRLQWSALPRVLSVRFPQLLALSTCVLSHWEAGAFTRLLYLHVSHRPSQCAEKILAEYAPPTLTHLRVSRMSDSSLVPFMRRQLTAAPGVESANRKAFPALQNICIQPRKLGGAICQQMMRELEVLVAEVEVGSLGTFGVMEMSGGYGYMDARDDWLDFMRGGEGCWHEKSDAS